MGVLFGWATAFSSFNPDLPNTDTGQDFLSDEWKDTVLGWFNGTGDNYGEDYFKREVTTENFVEMINPNVWEIIINATETEGIDDVCELAEIGKTDKLCEAIKMNNLQKDLRKVQHLTNLCWSPADELFSFDANLPAFWDRFINPNLRLFRIPTQMNNGQSGFESPHVVAGGYCMVLYALLFSRIFY